MRGVLLSEDELLGLSKRGARELVEVCESIAASERQGSLLLDHMPSGRLRWWTFAGGAVNSSLALRLGEIGSTRMDDLWVQTAPGISVPARIQLQAEPSVLTAFAQGLADRSELKFSVCLHPHLLAAVVVSRSLDDLNLRRIGRE